MTGKVREPAELTSPGRGTSSCAQGSTGLHYSTCYQIDEDILCRIRSLQLSQHTRRPPRTPFSSQEGLSIANHEVDESIAFKTTNSVAKLAHPLADSSVTAPERRVRSKTMSFSTFTEVGSYPKLPPRKVSITERHTLRNSESADDMQQLIEHTNDRPEKEKYRRFSRYLLLQDQLTTRHNPILSSFDGEHEPFHHPPPNINEPEAKIVSISPDDQFAQMNHLIQSEMRPPNCSLSTYDSSTLPGLAGHKISAQAGNLSSEPSELQDTSLNPLPNSPSIDTGASRKSARHALLKPSVSQTPIDTGLPVPPVLITAPAEPEQEKVLEPRVGTSFGSLTSMASHELAPNGTTSSPSKTRDSEAQKPLPEVPPIIDVTYVVKAETKTIANPHLQEQSVQEPAFHRPFPTFPADSTRSGTPNSEYWGFVPAVKEAVNDAVQVAVRRAVHQVNMPPGAQKDEASAAYRKLVGASLAKAALIADDYIRRSSVWEESSTNGSKDKLEMNLDLPYAPPMETVPLESAKVAVGENFRSGWKITVPWKKDSPHVYDAIPARESSRKVGFRSKIKGANATAIVALKAIGSRKESSSETPESTNGTSAEVDNGTQHSTTDNNDGHPSTKGNKDPKKVSINTAHWVRDLLSNEGLYETKLTEMPQRQRRQRSLTAPSKPASDLYLEEPAKHLHPKFGIPKSDSLHSFERQQAAASETFTKTLNELEHLLSEALAIARQAAEEENAPYAPQVLETATEVLKGNLVRQEGVAAIKSVAFTGHHKRSSVGSMHESLMSCSESSGSDSDDYAHEDPTVPHNLVEKADKIVKSTQIFQIIKTVASCGRRIAPYSVLLPSRPASPSSNEALNNLSVSVQKGDDCAISFVNANPEKPESKQLTREGRCRSLPMAPSTPRQFSMKTIKSGRIASDRVQLFENISPILRKGEVRDYITSFKYSFIQPRRSSWRPNQAELWKGYEDRESIQPDSMDITMVKRFAPGMIHAPYSHSYDGSVPSDTLDFEAGYTHKLNPNVNAPATRSGHGVELRDIPAPNLPEHNGVRHRPLHLSAAMFDLSGKSHISISKEHRHGFSLTRSHKRQAIARDWSPIRKRFVASVACFSTALIGLLTGIYGAEVPAIQYYIVDFHHYTILGNVLFFIGLAISSFVCWPLPLLHGRKPYTLSAMCLAMPLLFPQALVVGGFRSPYVSQWRVGLLLPRALMGLVLGMANMNFQLTLTDVFGASLQSSKPHQEMVDENDVRRHGGGMGMWLGIWTWCQVASNGIGFLIGAAIINTANPAWGFYVSICIIALVLLVNILCPEVRRAAFRRSVAEVKEGDQVSHRLARGEVKMHMVQSGPKWWGQEFWHGFRLSGLMLRQSGFLIMAMYVAWIYGQIVLTVVLLGSLMSKYYHFKSPYVGAAVTALPIGALLSVPFQKAGLFSRDRSRLVTDDDTRDNRITWSSHLIRRAIFVLVLPFAGLAYTLSSNGPPIPFIIPILFAGLIGFLSALAMAECYGIIMETFDVSDLQPGMTGRPRKSRNDKNAYKRTNYSSFPRVSAGFAITQSFGYLIAAAATGVGGVAQRHLGQQAATGVMAGILLVLSLLLLAVLVRFREVQIIPDLHKAGMLRYIEARRASTIRRGSVLDPDGDDDLRPVIIGNPTGTTRRMCVLELGSLSRWSEIRRKNHLVDQSSLEAKHPNIATLVDIEDRIKSSAESIRDRLSREGSLRSRRSASSQPLESYKLGEPGDLGGHREMLARPAGNGITPTRGGSGRIVKRKTTIQEDLE